MNAFRPTDQVVGQDWPRLAAWLAARGRHLDLGAPIRQFGTGLANLNYLLTVDGVPVVFRRPPAGPVAAGANDMAREFGVLGKLADHFALVPRPIEFGDDVSVVGVPFQLIEYRSGTAIGGTLPDQARVHGVGAKLTADLISAMATLHALDPVAVGLGELGRPQGFLGRQVEGWARRSSAAYDNAEPSSVKPILTYLRANVPSSQGISLLHLDLKFDNMLYDLDRLEPVAIVDWDMTTRGDALYDLGVLLSYWVEPGDPQEIHALEQVPSLEPGFPSRAEVAAMYFAATGREPAELDFYIILARFRLAVVFQQLYVRFLSGALKGPKYSGFYDLARQYLDWTESSLSSSARPL